MGLASHTTHIYVCPHLYFFYLIAERDERGAEVGQVLVLCRRVWWSIGGGWSVAALVVDGLDAHPHTYTSLCLCMHTWEGRTANLSFLYLSPSRSTPQSFCSRDGGEKMGRDENLSESLLWLIWYGVLVCWVC